MTGLWSHLSWREPLWLLLALVPWITWGWRRWRGDFRRRLGGYADPHLWPWLLVGAPRLRTAMLVALAWLLAAVAAAGPRWDSATQEQQARRGIDIMVVVDISPSMLVTDVSPSRLRRAKLKLNDFLDFVHGDRLGLIPFSANAYLTLPLTHDKDTFTYFVNALAPGLVSKTGSDLQRALALAGRTLQAGGQRGRAIVLISDGESHGQSALATARRLGKAGIPVYILGMGTADGGPVPTPQGQFLKYRGQVVVSRLQRARLRRLAQASGGAYTDLRDDDRDWAALFKAMRRHVPQNRYSITTARPNLILFPWFLAASLALFLLAGGGRTSPALLALILLPPVLGAPQPAYAWPWQEQSALHALRGGDYARAVRVYGKMDGYKGRLGAGAGLYRLRDYAAAAAQFRRAAALAADDTQLAKAEYDLGNAYARLGRLQQAGDAYRRALQARPNYPHAALNLTLVNKTRRTRMGGRASAHAKLTRRDTSHQGPASRTPLSAQSGHAAGRARSAAEQAEPPAARSHTGAGGTPAKPQPPEILKQWAIKPGELNEDLSAALQRLKSLKARPDALMSFFYSEQDVKAGILPQEKRW